MIRVAQVLRRRAVRSGATAAAIDAVCRSIREHVYRPGDRLPSERELAEALSVSRPTMREAIQSLATLNIVDVRRGSGIYVGALSTEALLQPLLMALELTQPTAQSLFDVRLALEPLAASLAAANAEETQLAAMRACVEPAQGELTPRRVITVDARLHRLIAEASGNDLLLGLIASLDTLTLESRRRTARVPGVIERSLRDHRSIVRAIDKGDRAGAERAMRRHLLSVERGYRSASG
jgi:GntR family transcriptional repressor for pyruvate dehydrogenase complex